MLFVQIDVEDFYIRLIKPGVDGAKLDQKWVSVKKTAKKQGEMYNLHKFYECFVNGMF